jgi:hypothetical protein
MKPPPIEPENNKAAWIGAAAVVTAALIGAAVGMYKPPAMFVIVPPRPAPDRTAPEKSEMGVGSLPRETPPPPTSSTSSSPWANWEVRIAGHVIPFSDPGGQQFELVRTAGLGDFLVCATQEGISAGTMAQVSWEKDGVLAGEASFEYGPNGQQACTPFTGLVARGGQYSVRVSGPFAPSTPLGFSLSMRSPDRGSNQ